MTHSSIIETIHILYEDDTHQSSAFSNKDRKNTKDNKKNYKNAKRYNKNRI